MRERLLIAERVGTNIERLLLERNITQSYLAMRIHVVPSSISQIVCGKRLSDSLTYWRIAKELGVSMSELYGDSDNIRIARRELENILKQVEERLTKL